MYAGGLALGREGPSIQLGSHGGKRNISWIRQRKNRRKISSDPVAQARVWPPLFMHRLPGVMFSLEEVHKNFSVSVLVSVMSASLTADFLSSTILGMDSVFQFDILKALPMEYYWMILLLGVVLGITGAFYNWFTLRRGVLSESNVSKSDNENSCAFFVLQDSLDLQHRSFLEADMR